MLGRDKYFGFAVDWFLELIFVSSTFVIFVTISSLYLGLCFYMTSMVADVKAQITRSAKVDRWAIYVKEIAFHVEIMEYGFPLAGTF